jgi:hypothetical protein
VQQQQRQKRRIARGPSCQARRGGRLGPASEAWPSSARETPHHAQSTTKGKGALLAQAAEQQQSRAAAVASMGAKKAAARQARLRARRPHPARGVPPELGWKAPDAGRARRAVGRAQCGGRWCEGGPAAAELCECGRSSSPAQHGAQPWGPLRAESSTVSVVRSQKGAAWAGAP